MRTKKKVAVCLSAGLLLMIGVARAAATERVLSDDYRVTVAGQPVDVIAVPMPENCLKEADRQPYSYAAFIATNAVRVRVESRAFDLSATAILPKLKGVAALSKAADAVVFEMTPPMTLVLEPQGRHRALVISANRPEANPPRPDDPKVKYFGPGLHREDVIRIGDGETLYLAPGAWVEGCLKAKGRNMAVCGSGVLSGACWEWQKGPRRADGKPLAGSLTHLSGTDIAVRDVTLFSSFGWTLVFSAVTNVVVDNVKILGGRVINDDGIDICRARDVTVRNSFVRCQDDCLAPKWWCENVVCTNLTLWTDAANGVRIGYECERGDSGRVFRDMFFGDIDILHLALNKTTPEQYWANSAICIQPSNGQTIHDPVFEDIRFHACDPQDIFLNVKTMPITQGVDCKEAGVLKGLTLRNIRLPDSKGGMCVNLSSHDGAHPIEDVRFENVSGYGPVTKSGNVKFFTDSAAGQAKEIVVSPDGLSPRAALEQMRAARASGNAAVRKVRVKAGIYFLDDPLVLTPSDSGAPDAPVEWIGETGAVFSVGCPVRGWREEADGTWSAPAPKGTDGASRLVEQLWVNGRRAERSCYPKEGFFFPTKRTDVPVTNAAGTVCWHETIGVTNEDVRAVLAALSPVERAHAQITVLDLWTYARRALMGYDAEKGEMMSFASRPWTQWAQIRLTSRLKIENVRAGFTAPGDWLYDGAEGRLRYRPRPGETLGTMTAVADVPGSSRVLEFRGDPDRGMLVHDIVFRGIGFAHASMMATDGSDLLPDAPKGVTQCYQFQAAHDTDAAVRMFGAQRVRFEDCRVDHTGNFALEMDDGCVSNAVVGCVFEDLGAGGVRMGSRKGHVAVGEKLTRRVIRTVAPRGVAFNEVSDCVIAGAGRTNPEGPGVLLTHCSDSRVVHCDIHDIRYSGVSVGWVWGYAGSVAQRNEIAYNRIWNLGQRLMADLGGVYTLGTSFGTHVHDNVIHDVHAYGYGGWGLYNDEGSEGVVMERNLVWNTTDGCYHQHFGVGNVIRNNIFAFNERDGAVRTYRTEVKEVPSSVEVVNNIVLTRNSPLVGGTAKPEEGPQNVAGIWCGNVWYDCAAPGVFNHRTWTEWQALGKETLSVNADPCFVDAAKLDFRLRPESPALKLGFKPWEYEKAGCRKRQKEAAR